MSYVSHKAIGIFSVGALVGTAFSGLLWQSSFLNAQASDFSVGDPTQKTPSAAEIQLIAPSFGDMMEGMPSYEELQKMAPELMRGYPSDSAMPSSFPGDQFVGDPTQKTPSAAEIQLIAPSFGDMMEGMPSYEELQKMAPSDLMQHVSQSDYDRMMKDVSNADISSISATAASAAAMPTMMPAVTPTTQDAALVQQLMQTINALQKQITQLQDQIAFMQKQQAAQVSMSSVSSSNDAMHSAAAGEGASSSASGWFDWLHWAW